MARRLAAAAVAVLLGCGARVQQPAAADTEPLDSTPFGEASVVDSGADIEDTPSCSLDGLTNLCTGPGAPADPGRCERFTCCGGRPCAGDCVDGRCVCGAAAGGCGVGHPAKYCCSYVGWTEPRCMNADHCFIAK